jgi:hypothetical protein
MEAVKNSSTGPKEGKLIFNLLILPANYDAQRVAGTSMQNGDL